MKIRKLMMQNIDIVLYTRIVLLALLVALIGVTGCESASDNEMTASPSEEQTLAAVGMDHEEGEIKNGDSHSAETTANPYKMSKDELVLWNNPSFKKEFIESYIARTDIEPRVTLDEREKLQKIFDLIAEDKKEEAFKITKKHLEKDAAASAVFDFTLANLYFQMADNEENIEEQSAEYLSLAAANYEAATEKYDKFLRAWKNLGIIYIRTDQKERAIPTLTKVIELGGSDATTYGLLGFSYSAAENSLSAESCYRMAILLDPETLDWKMGLAQSLFKQQRYAEAVSLCGQLIENNPENADLWLLQANAYLGLKQPLEAAEIFEFVDDLGESTAASLYLLGDIYVNEEIYELAVQTYIKAMEKDVLEKGDNANSQKAIRCAKVLIARGAQDQTRDIILKIEELFGNQIEDKDRKDLLKIRARLAVAAGQGQEEVEVLKQIVELDPLDCEALILLGQHSARSNDQETAVFYYERAASIEECEADAKVRHAQLLVSQGKYNDALPLLRRAQQIKPRDNIQEYLEQVERVSKTR